MSELTYQQISIFERLKENNQKVVDRTEAMRRRGTLVTASSTVVIGLATSANFLPSSSNPGFLSGLFLTAACLLSVFMYFFASRLWSKGGESLPGGTDIEKWYERFISKECDDAYFNFLKDLKGSYLKNIKENEAQADRFDSMVYLFMGQLFLLGLSVLTHGYL